MKCSCKRWMWFTSYTCGKLSVVLPGNSSLYFVVSDSNIFYVVGAMAHRGDLIACHVDFDNRKNSSIPILFSLNGKEVARTLMKYTAGQTKLYPFISLGYEGIRVLAKVCQSRIMLFSDETCFASLNDITKSRPAYVSKQILTNFARSLVNFHCQ